MDEDYLQVDHRIDELKELTVKTIESVYAVDGVVLKKNAKGEILFPATHIKQITELQLAIMNLAMQNFCDKVFPPK